MEVDNIVCRLCLNVCQTGFENIDNSTQEGLDFLLLHVDLDITRESVICSTCKMNLKKCFDIKADYLRKRNSTYTENRSIDLNNLKPDLSEEIDNPASFVSRCVICAFCMEFVDLNSSVFLKNEARNITTTLEKYFPELALSITEDSIICTSCYKSMQLMVGFINNCVNVEEKVKKYCNIKGMVSEGQIELTALVNLAFKGQLKSFDMQADNIAKVEEDHAHLENESKTQIKFEDCVEVEQHELSNIKEEPDIKVEGNSDRSMTRIEQVTEINMEMPLALLPYKCNACTHQSYSKDSLLQHIFDYHQGSEIKSHACKLCLYRTDSKDSFLKHALAHESSEVKMYRCEICAFQTKYKNSLLQHMLTHKDSTEVLMHTCKICEFQTKYKMSLRNHMLTHKTASEVEMFKCDMCPFESKHKCNLRPHMLVHKSPSEVRMFKCDTCSFKTKYKVNLQKHIMIHMSPSEVMMYTCEICTYQTKEKRYMRKHMLIHKSSTEVIVHKCNLCQFQNKYKSRLRQHQLVHKSPSEVRMFKCDTCSFETKYKGNLQTHILTHMRLSEETMYKY